MLRSLPSGAVLDALLDALESAGIGCTIVLDQNGHLERLYANAAVARIFGRDLEELRGRAPLELVPPEEHARLAAMRESLEAGGRGALSFQTAIVRPDNASVPVEVGLTFLPIDGKRAAFAFVRDVAERASMELALRESEERFRKLAEASPDTITVVANGKFTYANPAALRALGLSSFEQMASIDPLSLTPPAQRDAAAEIEERLARGLPIRAIEFRTRGPDGREQIFESSMTVAPMDGTPAVISYSRDITERVELQAEVMKQDRLASVGMLAAGVAHELNNPLTSLAFQTKRLLENADDLGLAPSVREDLAQMDEAATRMRQIIGDLLFMARPAEQPQAHVDIVKVLTSTIALLRAGAGSVPVELELPDLPPAYGYPSRLGQVFLNVLRNAAQAVEGMANGLVQVKAALSGELVEVSISDNGPGISAEDLERVARPFFTTKAKGMGLGLWISKSVMQDQGGTLEIASNEGEGTQVTLRVPLRATSPASSG